MTDKITHADMEVEPTDCKVTGIFTKHEYEALKEMSRGRKITMSNIIRECVVYVLRRDEWLK